MSASSEQLSKDSLYEPVTDETQESASASVQSSASEDLTKSGKMTAYLFFSVLVITFGSHFQFGYAIGSINAPAIHIKSMINDSHHWMSGNYLTGETMDIAWGSAASIFPFGALIGALMAGYLADRFGRRLTLHVNNFLAILAAAAMTSADFLGYHGFYPLFHFGRLLIGLNSGIGSCIAPLYVTELSPIRLRGAIGSVPQLMVTISILASQIVGLPQALGAEHRWPWIFAVGLIPASFQIVFLFLVPESPKYTLCFRENREAAYEALAHLRGRNDASAIDAELDALQAEMEKGGERVGVGNLFKRSLRWRTIIACVLMIGQQFSGINAIMFYSTDIFQKNVFSSNPEYAVYATVGVGFVNVLTTCVSIKLVEQPRLGRRFLLLFGNCGMIIAMVLLSGSLIIMNKVDGAETACGYISIVFVVLFVIAFASGPGSIPFFYVSEIFASDARASAGAVATAVNWICAFTIGLSFPSMQRGIGEYSFFVFAGCLVAATAFVVFFVPETKAKQLPEILDDVDARKPRCC